MTTLETDILFENYCANRHIQDPFRESRQEFAKRCLRDEKGITYVREQTEDEKAWEKEWKKRKEEYLRLSHTFRLWDFHFWMTWEQFEQHLKYDKDYTDVSIYMPCDCADRQCSMTCAYFGKECPRKHEELKAPQILEFEGRWEFNDDGE